MSSRAGDSAGHLKAPEVDEGLTPLGEIVTLRGHGDTGRGKGGSSRR